MKTKLLTVLFISLLSVCGMGTAAKAQVHISVYVNIPLAPNITLSIGSPLIQAPAPNYIWIDGYWTWDYRHHNYVWVQGYWALAPYADAYWTPGYWEYYRGGYRWIDACWTPRANRNYFGYCNGRYDYYGRPVYYHHYNHNDYRHGYAYSYDHNPNHRNRGYNSSPHFNSSPAREREAINKKYNNPRSAATTLRPALRENVSRSSSRSEATANQGRGSTVNKTRENASPTVTPSRENRQPDRSEAVNSGSRTRSQSTQAPAIRSSSANSRQSVSSGSRQPATESTSTRSSSRERSSNSSERTNSSGRTR